jgi:hypothetical protein
MEMVTIYDDDDDDDDNNNNLNFYSLIGLS